MGRAGAVACVSGRTAAYRRSVVMPVLENLENEFFLGRRCVAGDDGRLTWLVLASGYKTVHQSSARALSMFPDTFRAFVKQRVRWSRNSYRCYLTAAYKGWLWRVPFVTKVTVLQILLTPVTMGITLGYLVFSRLETDPDQHRAGRRLVAGMGVASAASRTCAGTRSTILPAAAVDAGRDLRRAADQALRLRHDEQAGLADPVRRLRRRRGPDQASPWPATRSRRVIPAPRGRRRTSSSPATPDEAPRELRGAAARLGRPRARPRRRRGRCGGGRRTSIGTPPVTGTVYPGRPGSRSRSGRRRGRAADGGPHRRLAVQLDATPAQGALPARDGCRVHPGAHRAQRALHHRRPARLWRRRPSCAGPTGPTCCRRTSSSSLGATLNLARPGRAAAAAGQRRARGSCRSSTTAAGSTSPGTTGRPRRDHQLRPAVGQSRPT